jgi:histidinol dehydrogenase
MAAQTLRHSKAVLVKTEAEAIELLNAYAAEHLILATDRAETLAAQVTNAGSVFLGHYTPEAAGDYASGTNHTLPTNGYARAYSGVSVDSFVKKITFQQITPDGLRHVGPVVEQMAAAEQLAAHRQAVSIRLEAIGRK